MSCERQLDEALRSLEDSHGNAQYCVINDACACIAELYRVPTVQQVPRDNASLHALLERMEKSMRPAPV